MDFRSLAFSFIVQLSGDDPTNLISSWCPSSNAYRGTWSISASCGLTLVICVWHAVHPNVPLPHHKWYHIFSYRLLLIGCASFVPEFMIAVGFNEWRAAKQITNRVHGAFLSIGLSRIIINWHL